MTVDVLENSVAKFADITIITIKKCCNGSQTCFAETFLGVVATYFSLFTFGFAFLRRDSAIPKRAWMALAAPSFQERSAEVGGWPKWSL